MKKGAIIIASCLVPAFLCFIAVSRTNASSKTVSVRPLFKKSYVDTVIREIRGAKQSIYIAMFVANYNEDISYSVENKILNEIVKAHQRGVAVKVILDKNIKYTKSKRTKKIDPKNKEVFKFLSQHNVPVCFDNREIQTHCKIMVIDHKTTILGSSNWTYSGLLLNNEANVLIRSPKTASVFLDMIKGIELEK